jgi:hypothetical protein
MDKDARLPSGMKIQEAAEITMDFLDWWKEYLEEHEPQAVNTIQSIENARESIPTDIEELGEEE